MQCSGRAHRLAAAKLLQWKYIPVTRYFGKYEDGVADPLKAELIEIDENLCRSELTGTDLVKATQRRPVIIELLQQQEDERALGVQI